MKQNSGKRVEAPPRRPGDGGVAATENPDVPGFRTWRGVYWFVFIAFIAGVVLLTLFSRVFA